MKKHQTTFHLEEKDKEALAKIREYYGATSDVAALRIALRETVRALDRQSQPPLPQTRNAFHPPHE